MNNIELANDPNASKEVLEKLSNDKGYGILYNVANNPNTPKEVLEKLSDDKGWDVRYYVAINSNTSKETLSNMLVNESNENVINAILKNKNTPEEIIAIYEVHQ